MPAHRTTKIFDRHCLAWGQDKTDGSVTLVVFLAFPPKKKYALGCGGKNRETEGETTVLLSQARYKVNYVLLVIRSLRGNGVDDPTERKQLWTKIWGGSECRVYLHATYYVRY